MKLRHKLTAIALSASTATISLMPLAAIMFPIWQEDKALAQFTEVAAPLTLGVILQNALDRAETVVRTAEQAGRGVVIQAGTQAYMTIQAAKNAYADSLDLTIDKLDASTTQKLQEIKSMMDTLESKADDQVEKTASLAQQITNTLPLANLLPQLTSYSPKFIAWITSPTQVEVEVKGNFIAMQKVNSRPSLKLGDQVYEAVESTTQSLKFLIPMSPETFKPAPVDNRAPGSQPANPEAVGEIAIKKATLSIPYDDGTIPAVVDQVLPKTPKVATYDLLFSVLPAGPGKITLITKSSRTEPVRVHLVSPTYEQNSESDDLKEQQYETTRPDQDPRLKDPNVTDPATQDWQVDPSSVRFVTEYEKGEWHQQLVQTNPSVLYKIDTIHHSTGSQFFSLGTTGRSGHVKFHFEYDVVGMRPVSDEKSVPIALSWGDTKTIPIEEGSSWKVQFTAFDGQKQEFAGADANRYLKVEVVGRNIILKAVHPNDIEG